MMSLHSLLNQPEPRPVVTSPGFNIDSLVVPGQRFDKAFSLPMAQLNSGSPSSISSGSFGEAAYPSAGSGIGSKQSLGLPSDSASDTAQTVDWKMSTTRNGKRSSAIASPKLEPSGSGVNGHDGNPTSSAPASPGGSQKAPLTGTAACIRTMERFKQNEIRFEVQLKDGASSFGQLFPEYPTAVTIDAYSSQAGWNSLWRPESLDQAFPEVTVRDQRTDVESKRTVAEFRAHIDQAAAADDIWIADGVHIMHPLSCVSSPLHKNCMGCSSFWKCMQSMREELRPWGSGDMLHFEMEHSESFFGIVSMNGSFSPQQRTPLACDTVNTLFYSDDPNGVVLWGFVPPWELSRLSEEEQRLLDQKVFVDPEYLERKVKVYYCVQKVGQTVCVPALWTFFSIRLGRGLAFSAQWSYLRAHRLADARRTLEANRALSVYQPINLSSIVQTAAFQILDDCETAATAVERRHACELLFKLLPVLKTQVLEELLGDKISMSAMVVLSYDSMVDMFSKRTMKVPFTTAQQHELTQMKATPLPNLDGEIKDDDDEDARFHCAHCKVVLWNLRRSCTQCQYDMCEPCFTAWGKHHQPHKMRKFRKMGIQNLLDLVENIRVALNEHEIEVVPPPSKKHKPHKEFKERERDRDRERESRPRRAAAPAPAPAAAEDDYADEEEQRTPAYDAGTDDETIDCVCGNNRDMGFMISCELCRCWLHGRCVGINKRNEPDEYYCPRCIKKTGMAPQNFNVPPPLIANTGILQPKNFSPDEKLRQYGLV